MPLTKTHRIRLSDAPVLVTNTGDTIKITPSWTLTTS